MRKRRIIILGAAIVAVLGGVIWWVAATRPPAAPDPVYDGHPLSYWVNNPLSVGLNGIDIPAMDSNAVPYLIEALKRRDGSLRIAWKKLWVHFPVRLRQQVGYPMGAEDVRFNSCAILGDLNTEARPAISELVRALRDDDAVLRREAAQALGRIANGKDKPVVEALVAAVTKDMDANARVAARDALSRIDPEAAANAGVTNTAPLPSPMTNYAGAVP